MADRISMLPDEVLCHILSFLPTKDAIATSVLSKRWKPLWLSVPTLHFEDECPEDEETNLAFVRFVYGVMLSRFVLQNPIKTFRLKCEFQHRNPIDVNKWVNASIQRGIEHLDLDLWQGPEAEWGQMGPLMLPSTVFSCTTLVVLKLRGAFGVEGFPFDLPSLKIMHLAAVSFSSWQCLMELLYACPNLEELEGSPVYYYGDDEFDEGEFKSLPKLTRANVCPCCIPLKVVCNVEFLRIGKCLPSSHAKCIPTFRNLTHMELVRVDCPEVVEILRHCPKLQDLVFQKVESNEVFEENWAYLQFVPECLSLQLKRCSLINYRGLEGELRLADYIMQNAKHLWTMTVRCSIYSDPQEKLQMLKDLSLLPRMSSTCKLLFE